MVQSTTGALQVLQYNTIYIILTIDVMWICVEAFLLTCNCNFKLQTSKAPPEIQVQLIHE